MKPFWVKPHSCLNLKIYDSMVCFLLPKCVFLYQCCLSGLSSQHCDSMIFAIIRTFFTTLCFYDFFNNSAGKKMHTLPRCGLIFPFQMPYFLHWLFSSTLLIQLKPPEAGASEQAAQKVEGAVLKLLPGLTRPGPCKPKFWKNDLPATGLVFAVRTSPKA